MRRACPGHLRSLLRKLEGLHQTGSTSGRHGSVAEHIDQRLDARWPLPGLTRVDKDTMFQVSRDPLVSAPISVVAGCRSIADRQPCAARLSAPCSA